MKSNDWRHKNVARYTPGNTKMLYFFNCLLDGMHTKIKHICDFSRCGLNARFTRSHPNLAPRPQICFIYLPEFVCFASSVNQDFFAPKYSLVSFITVPDKRNTAIKFGMDISPLNVSAILHNNPKSTVAPRIATSE